MISCTTHLAPNKNTDNRTTLLSCWRTTPTSVASFSLSSQSPNRANRSRANFPLFPKEEEKRSAARLCGAHAYSCSSSTPPKSSWTLERTLAAPSAAADALRLPAYLTNSRTTDHRKTLLWCCSETACVEPEAIVSLSAQRMAGTPRTCAAAVLLLLTAALAGAAKLPPHTLICRQRGAGVLSGAVTAEPCCKFGWTETTVPYTAGAYPLRSTHVCERDPHSPVLCLSVGFLAAALLLRKRRQARALLRPRQVRGLYRDAHACMCVSAARAWVSRPSRV